LYILGINAFQADAAAALLGDGELLVAVAEERFTRQRHEAGFPTRAVRHCLEAAGIGPGDLDHVAIARDPQADRHKRILFGLTRRGVFAKTLLDQLASAARLRDGRVELARALGVAPDALRATFHQVEHPKAHLASAFFVSGFDAAALCSLDGCGDLVSTMWGRGEGNRILVEGEVEFPHSLGLLFTAVSQWLGFSGFGEESKVMELAPHGEPKLLDRFLDELLHLEDGGRFRLGLEYFDHATTGLAMTWDEGRPNWGRVFGDALVRLLGAPREPGTELTCYHEDVAASLQRALELGIGHVLAHLQRTTGETRLCLAGSVALNAVANGKIPTLTRFTEVFVPPAAADDGTALGAACWVWHQLLGNPRRFVMERAATGPSYSSAQVAEAVEAYRARLGGMVVEQISDVPRLVARLARELAAGRVCGWFQGRLEFGPQALGQRTLVADPRRREMKDVLNARLAHREPFRPFTLSILAEAAGDYFTLDHPSPFQHLVFPIRPEHRAKLEAVSHVDGTGRLQTVEERVLPKYHALLAAFARETGVPMVLATSFDEDAPLVCTPREALDCFVRTDMDVLVLEDWYIARG